MPREPSPWHPVYCKDVLNSYPVPFVFAMSDMSVDIEMQSVLWESKMGARAIVLDDFAKGTFSTEAFKDPIKARRDAYYVYMTMGDPIIRDIPPFYLYFDGQNYTIRP